MHFKQTTFVGVLVTQPEQGVLKTWPGRAQEVEILPQAVIIVLPDDVPEVAVHAACMDGILDGNAFFKRSPQCSAVRDQGWVGNAGHPHVVGNLAKRTLKAS